MLFTGLFTGILDPNLEMDPQIQPRERWRRQVYICLSPVRAKQETREGGPPS